MYKTIATIICKTLRRWVKNTKIGPPKIRGGTHAFDIYYRDLDHNEIDHLPLGIFDQNVNLEKLWVLYIILEMITIKSSNNNETSSVVWLKDDSLKRAYM